jgi:hypothetical protein
MVLIFKVPMATRQFPGVTRYLTSISVKIPLGAAWKALHCRFCLDDQPHLEFSYKLP